MAFTKVAASGISTGDSFVFKDIDATGIITSSTIKVGSAVTIHTSGYQIGSSNLHSTGLEAQNINVVGIVTAAGGFNIGIQSAGVNITTGVVTALNFVGAGNTFAVNGNTVDISIAGGGGGAGAGLGTALSEDQSSSLNNLYYVDQILSIGSTVTVTAPDSSNVAYTNYSEIAVEEGYDLIVDDGDDLVPDILGLVTNDVTPLGGAGGRVRADNFTNKAGTGAPTFPNGVNVTGIVTATSFSGNFDGNASTSTTAEYATTAGIATSSQGLTGSPNITVGDINSSGLNVTGIVTATGGFNLGISSAGTSVTTGPITTLNFVGSGNTFAVNGSAVDISISGGGGSSSGVSTGGQVTFLAPGSHLWTCPSGVTSVSCVVIGAGAAGDQNTAGGGGGLSYKNNISVTPGETYEIHVGRPGHYTGSNITAEVERSGTYSAAFGMTAGGGRNNSSTSSTNNSGGGASGGDANYSGGAGGAYGGYPNSGGGGAAGYTQNGSAGGNGTGAPNYIAGAGGDAGNAGTSGGYGGAAGGNYYGGQGGGTGLYGIGADAQQGSSPGAFTYRGGTYGGGAGSRGGGPSHSSGWANGGNGAVRIVWPGDTRQFPSTNLGDYT